MPSGIYQHKPLSEEHKRKLSNSHIGCIPWNKGEKLHYQVWNKGLKGTQIGYWKGKHLTEETKRKIGLAGKGRKHTEEAKKKISLASKGRVSWNKGLRLSEETRRKISVALKGQKPKNFYTHIYGKRKGTQLSDEQRQRLIVVNKGRKQSEETIKKRTQTQKGRKHSEESKRKMSASQKGKVFSKETRKKMSLARLGKNVGHQVSEETRRKISLANLGSRRSEEFRKRMSIANTGKKRSEEFKKRISEWQILHPNRKFHDTSIEIKMKELLDSLGIEYFSQFPLEKVAIVDFYVPSKKLAIFCDGCYWHGCPIHYPASLVARVERDNLQTIKLQNLGYKVSRFWEHDIKNMITLQI